MVSLILSILVAAVIAVGLTDVLKNFLPANLPTRVKTAVGVVVDAGIGVAVALVSASMNGANALGAVLSCIVVAIGTVGVANVGYNYIAKLIAGIKEKLAE